MGVDKKDFMIRLCAVILLFCIIGVGAYIAYLNFIVGPKYDDYSVVFVIGARCNSRTINFDNNIELTERINWVVESYGYAAIVVADGMPANQTNVFDFSPHKPSTQNKIVERGVISDNINNFKHNLLEIMKTSRAKEPEANVLEAINIAARMLSSRPDKDIKEIVVLGTGLSTTGWLDFTDDNNWLYSDATEIIDMLNRNSNLPDLNGIILTWFQMHDVAEPQADLPGSQRSNLEETWRLIAMDSGAIKFNISDAQPGREIYTKFFPPSGLPDVSVVPIVSVITGVAIHPDQVDVQRGTGRDFSALVVGIGEDFPKEVEWSIEGPQHPGTTVQQDGTVNIAPDDFRDNIVIIARSVADPNVSGKATIRLTDSIVLPGLPEHIVITPGPELILDTEPPFNNANVIAIVEGDNNPSQHVTFELIDNTDPKTTVSSDGRIVIAPDEASFLIILRVTSVVDPSVYNEINIIVRRPPDVVEVRFIGNTAEPVSISQAREAVKEWVDFINSQDSGIYLFGCTANTGHGGTGVTLGLDRANAIKKIFVDEFYVEPTKIITEGLGHNNPWDRPNGISGMLSWNESIAATNRRVVIMSADDEFAKKVHNGTWQ